MTSIVEKHVEVCVDHHYIFQSDRNYSLDTRRRTYPHYWLAQKIIKQNRMSFRRCATKFGHHANGIARLNHGSFGSPHPSTLEATLEHYREWLSQPDALYFSGNLFKAIQKSERKAALALDCQVENISFVENATTATAIVLKRWKGQQKDGNILALSTIYGGCKRSLEFSGLPVFYSKIPFPQTTHALILQNFEVALQKYKPTYIYLDHISSQPAITMPLESMIDLCRRTPSVKEIAVDAAHALGNIATKISVEKQYDVDFYFTNLHKWAFASHSVCALYSRLPLEHVVLSWDAGNFQQECRWSGTRDYAAYVSAYEALCQLEQWRSDQSLDVATYNSRGIVAAAADLRSAWDVGPAYDEDECASSMIMLKLPPHLDLSHDRPGVPDTSGLGARSRLRSQYNIEAAVAAFPVLRENMKQEEGFLRLSHAVYTSDDDITRLRDAILEMR